MSHLNTVVLVALGAELSVSQAAARAAIYCGDGSDRRRMPGGCSGD